MNSGDLYQYNNLPLRDEVFNYLRSSILKGELKTGMKLMEKTLADKLGVSRTPVREALRMLSAEGLVNIIPRRGTFVADITEDDIKDVLEIRASLESLAVRLSCRRITKEELIELNNVNKKFLKAVEEEDVDEIIKQDINFHRVLYGSTKNKKLIAMIKNISDQVYRFRVSYVKQMDNYMNLAEEHKKILIAISKKDERLASELAIDHIEKQQTNILESFNEDS